MEAHFDDRIASADRKDTDTSDYNSDDEMGLGSWVKSRKRQRILPPNPSLLSENVTRSAIPASYLSVPPAEESFSDPSRHQVLGGSSESVEADMQLDADLIDWLSTPYDANNPVLDDSNPLQLSLTGDTASPNADAALPTDSFEDDLRFAAAVLGLEWPPKPSNDANSLLFDDSSLVFDDSSIVFDDSNPLQPLMTVDTAPPTAYSVPPTADSVPPTADSVLPIGDSVPPIGDSVPPIADPVPQAHANSGTYERLFEQMKNLFTEDQILKYFKILSDAVRSDVALFTELLQHSPSVKAITDSIQSNPPVAAAPIELTAQSFDPPIVLPNLLHYAELTKNSSMFAGITPFYPVRMNKTDSGFINCFIKLRPNGTAAGYIGVRLQELFERFCPPGARAGIPDVTEESVLALPALSGRIRLRHGKKIVDFDDKEFFIGSLRLVFERFKLHYQCQIYFREAYPERHDKNRELLLNEIKVVFECIKLGYIDLKLLTYDDLLLLFTFQYGFALAVYDSKTSSRTVVKTYMSKIILTGLAYHPPAKTKDKAENARKLNAHQERLMAHSKDVVKKCTIVYPLHEKEKNVQPNYTNYIYSQTASKVLYSDDDKVGRVFPKYFGKAVPNPFQALTTVVGLNCAEEFNADGSYQNVKFEAVKYAGIYAYHREEVDKVEAGELGELYKEIVKRWAEVGSGTLPLYAVNSGVSKAKSKTDEQLPMKPYRE